MNRRVCPERGQDLRNGSQEAHEGRGVVRGITLRKTKNSAHPYESGRRNSPPTTTRIMKTTLKNIIGWGSVLALVAGFTASSVAGPGPQYWTQKPTKTPVAAPEKAAPAAPAMACPNCKTSLVTEFSPTTVSGKLAPSFKPIGSRHECTACGGAVTRIRGQVTDDMKANCPICAKAKAEKAGCCSL